MKCGTQGKRVPQLEKKLLKAAKVCDRTQYLPLRPPTNISKVKDSVPRPKCRPVKNGLPIWNTQELDEKVPMYHGYGPRGRIVPHRGLMGKNPLKPDIKDAKCDFLLNDPYCNDGPYVYNALHDSHLKNWVRSGKRPEFLYKQGLINEDLEVECNLKEYNQYRRFLWHKHNDAVNKKIKYQDQLDLEKIQINRAIHEHQKDLTKKLKQLKHIIDKTKREDLEKTKVYNKKPIPAKTVKKCKPPLEYKKIETYTVYGVDKNGAIDRSKYQKTCIKGSQNEFCLLGFFDHLFEDKEKTDLKKKKPLRAI